MKQVLFEEITDGLVINRIIRDAEYAMPTKHFHREFEVYYLLAGERYYFIDNQTYLVKKGSIVFIDHDQIHKTDCSQNPFHDRIIIELNGAYLSALLASSSDFSITQFFSKHWGVIQLNEDAQRYIETLLFGIAHEIHHKNTNYQTMTYLKLLELFIYISRYKEHTPTPYLTSVTSTTTKHQKVHELTLYITEHYQELNSLEDLANRFYISKCHLSRIFKEVTGFTVNEYINISKIKQAQKMLITSNCKISEISTALGYQNVTYFEKIFKKYTETTPLKYRQKNLLTAAHIREQRAE